MNVATQARTVAWIASSHSFTPINTLSPKTRTMAIIEPRLAEREMAFSRRHVSMGGPNLGWVTSHL